MRSQRLRRLMKLMLDEMRSIHGPTTSLVWRQSVHRLARCATAADWGGGADEDRRVVADGRVIARHTRPRGKGEQGETINQAITEPSLPSHLA